jgi:hypothetical protein
MASSVTVIINQPGLCPCLVISNLDFDKRRKKKKEKEEEEKKFGNSKPRHFPKEMAEAIKIYIRNEKHLIYNFAFKT